MDSGPCSSDKGKGTLYKEMAEERDWEELPPEWAVDTQGKYNATMTNISSKHGTEIRLVAEDRLPTASHLSKKKLKDLLTKQNNDILSFLVNPEKVHLVNSAESIFRRYGREVPTLQFNAPSTILTDLSLDASLHEILEVMNGSMENIHEVMPVDTYVSQTRWLAAQYKLVGEEVLRLETILFQKIDQLDKLQQRVPLITGLAPTEALSGLIDSFTAYADSVYQASRFEEHYKGWMEAYKKWNVCRQLLSLPMMMRQSTVEPPCSICLLEPVSNVMVPCGHTFCGVCSKKQTTTCYICRGQIRERVKMFFA